MPIRIQALLTFSLIVMLLTIVFASRAAMIASQAVRERIVQQTATNTATFLATQNFPMGDHLMSQLNRMFDVQFVAVEKQDTSTPDTPPGKILGTSLQGPARETVGEVFEHLPSSGQLKIDGTRFFYHAGKPLHSDLQPHEKETILYVLIPETQLSDAATSAFWGVVRFGLIVLVVGSVLTWFFAERFTRPIRRLARAMDDPAQLPDQPAGTSDEIRQLYRSFATLLERQKQSQQVLVDSERLVAIGRMAAAVAHELRNPLSGIKMNLQVLQDSLEQDDPSLDLALQEVDRMELYLKEIMHLVVPGGEAIPRRMVTEQTTCQPAEAIRAALLLFAGRLRHAGIEVDVNLPKETMPQVPLGDSEYRQVLANLLINAMEATPEGGTLQISATIEENRVKTAVRDSGSGVTLKDRKDPFQIFASTKVDGTGLGLYICKKIVDDVGGRIGYENNADSPGATFWFELPFNDD
ncbi:MAG: HAMP domain-containing sensor histidine kinase [Planctomycetia bacterium]|jgi:signal transduction histidine kinase